MCNSKLDDDTLRDILIQTKVIAVVGHSDNPTRISYQIAQFLRQVNYIVIPVNPTVSEIDGQPCYASLRDIPQSIDLVNVFRRSELLPEIVSNAIASLSMPKPSGRSQVFMTHPLLKKHCKPD